VFEDVEEGTENSGEKSGDEKGEASLWHVNSEYVDLLTPIPMMSGLPAMMQVPLATPIASVEFIPASQESVTDAQIEIGFGMVENRGGKEERTGLCGIGGK
jgi:hypothetical protein